MTYLNNSLSANMAENNSWIECATAEAFHVNKKLIKVSCKALCFLFFFSDNYLTTGLERERERERERELKQELLTTTKKYYIFNCV